MRLPNIIQTRKTSCFGALFVSLLGAALWLACQRPIPAPVQGRCTPEERAIAFLGREVPRWQRENHCYSCHNNGDGARALLEAARQGFSLPPRSADATR